MSAASRNSRGDSFSLRDWAEDAEAAAGIARAMVGTPFVPDSLRRWQNPDERDYRKRVLDMDGTVATVTAVLLAGQELGLKPMASLRSFTIIKGTVAMYALAARGILQSAGHEVVVVETTSTRAIVRARRFGDDGEWQFSTWDTERARLAGLWPGHPDGNWKKQTKAMLVARATAEACRWVAADALMGIPAMVEELEDGDPIAAIESAATSPAAIDPPKAAGTTRKRSAPARRALPTAPAAPPPQPPEPPPEPAPSAAQAAPAAKDKPAATQPARVQPHVTPQGRTRIVGLLAEIGVTGREDSLALLAAWVGHPLESTKDLTPDEATAVIERLTPLAGIAAKPADAQAAEPATDEPDAAPPAEEGPPGAEPDDG